MEIYLDISSACKGLVTLVPLKISLHCKRFLQGCMENMINGIIVLYNFIICRWGTTFSGLRFTNLLLSCRCLLWWRVCIFHTMGHYAYWWIVIMDQIWAWNCFVSTVAHSYIKWLKKKIKVSKICDLCGDIKMMWISGRVWSRSRTKRPDFDPSRGLYSGCLLWPLCLFYKAH